MLKTYRCSGRMLSVSVSNPRTALTQPHWCHCAQKK